MIHLQIRGSRRIFSGKKFCSARPGRDQRVGPNQPLTAGTDGLARRKICFRPGGFTIVESVIVLGLISIMVIASLNTITLLDRSSRRQALHTTAMEIAQAKIEEIQSTTYNPPLAPFVSYTTNQTTNVILVLNKSGTATLVGGTLTAAISPSSQGHLVTVTVTTTNASQLLSVQLQTLVNRMSGGQP